MRAQPAQSAASFEILSLSRNCFPLSRRHESAGGVKQRGQRRGNRGYGLVAQQERCIAVECRGGIPARAPCLGGKYPKTSRPDAAILRNYVADAPKGGGRPWGKWSVTVATSSHLCFDFSHCEKVGNGKF